MTSVEHQRLREDAQRYLSVPANERLINIHIPKTAGTLIQRMFEEIGIASFGELDLVGSRHDAIGTSTGVIRQGYRAQLDQLDIKLAFSAHPYHVPRFDQTFKIAVVRNPFDYLVSYYHHDFGRNYEASDEVLKKLGWTWELPMGFHRCNALHGITGFDDFISKYTEPWFSWCHPETKKFLFWQLFDNHQSMPFREEILRANPELTSVMDCMGPVGVNAIIRYERLKEGLEIVLDALQLSPDSFDVAEYMKSNRPSAGHLYREHRDYRKYYNDETIALVETHCARELEMFCYDFEGPTDDRIFIDSTDDIAYPSCLGYNLRDDIAAYREPSGDHMIFASRMKNNQPSP